MSNKENLTNAKNSTIRRTSGIFETSSRRERNSMDLTRMELDLPVPHVFKIVNTVFNESYQNEESAKLAAWAVN